MGSKISVTWPEVKEGENPIPTRKRVRRIPPGPRRRKFLNFGGLSEWCRNNPRARWFIEKKHSDGTLTVWLDDRKLR